jgi:glucose/arabinose dehydrogenase
MRRHLLVAALLVVVAACRAEDETRRPRAAPDTTTTSELADTTTTTTEEPGSTTAVPTTWPTTARARAAAPRTTATTRGTVTSTTTQGAVRLEVTEVARGLDTPWALAWDASGRLWFTERPGRLTRMGEPPRTIPGVLEQGESGLMGLELDRQGRIYLMYTTATDNRVVRTNADGTGQTVLVEGIRRAAIHDGGRIRFGPDGLLYVGTGDAADRDLAQDDGSRNGKTLRIDPDSGTVSTFSKGHRNAQGLCFAPDGRFLQTEHGPDRGDEINVVGQGFNGGWPDTVGNGIRNYTPTIAPAGCVVYAADLIPQWRGSMLFVTLKQRDLRRITFRADGSVAGEEVLFDGRFGRLRDVAVGPDGAVYLATSNRDGRGSPSEGDDRILRVAPVP